MAYNKRKIGAKYEDYATNYLISAGYTIKERNYRKRGGEIDIIAKKDGVYIFAEVKYRSTRATGDALEAVDYKKQIQISKMAAHYLARYKLPLSTQIRFDVIGIDGSGRIEHIENAFSYCWRG